MLFQLKKNKMRIIITLFMGVLIFILLKYLGYISILNFLENLFLLKYLPKLGPNTGYGLIFIFGVLTSFHCIGMCGGIAISQTVGNGSEASKSEGQKSNTWFLPSLLYNGGRVVSYTAVGGLVGGIGSIISFSGVLKGIVPVIGGIFMIIMGINLLGIFPLLRRFNIRRPLFIAKKINRTKGYRPFYIGLLTGLMPCGPLQIIQLYALGTRSVLFGAFSSFIFSIGTVPLLFAFGAINTVINKKNSWIILKASALIVLVLGVVMIGRGMALYGITFDVMSDSDHKTSGTALVDHGIQTVITKIKSDSYPEIIVQKGIPVKWILRVEEKNLNQCNNAIVISELNINKKLVVGDNLIKFKPAKEGNIIYTCWMGMIKSKIRIINKIKD
jgi:sulfite exporter TauE/SafE